MSVVFSPVSFEEKTFVLRSNIRLSNETKFGLELLFTDVDPLNLKDILSESEKNHH